MAEALSRNSVEYELISMAGQGHGFDRDLDNPTVGDAFAKVLAFLDMHIGAIEA